MSEHHHPTPEEMLDAYLDGQLNAWQREAFEQAMREDPKLAGMVELQAKIDASLAHSFTFAEPQDRLIEPSAEQRVQFNPAAPKNSLPRRRVAVIAIAASLVLAVTFATLWAPDRRLEPFFEPTPLAALYIETINSGFEPYYECRDAERFASTFLKRQDQPLQLLPMGPRSEMLGLSYPGGLSRDTTAMLCEVEGKPVMVFVDRVTADTKVAAENDDDSLNIFRTQRDGLVFYEVTPFTKPRVTKFLQSPSATVPGDKKFSSKI